MKCILILFVLYTSTAFSISTLDIRIENVDKFPHNIDENFTICIYHSEIEKHHINALIVLRVKFLNENQTINLHPGFLETIDFVIKEKYFHATHFETSPHRTKVIVKFYKEAHGGEFTLSYSAKGAEQLMSNVSPDLIQVYRESVLLYHPPILELRILSEDGHPRGLRLNRPGVIICSSYGGFPDSSLNLEYPRKLKVIGRKNPNGNSTEIEFFARLSDHMTTVVCKSGGYSVTKQIKIFHHATSVEITPGDKQYMRHNSVLECKSYGGGYPSPFVQWSIFKVNKTSSAFFNISSAENISFLKIHPTAPNNSQWQFNCSSLNTIPHLDHSGPYKLINITIGENPEAARLAAARIWTISFVVIVILIVFLIGLMCFGSKFSCRRSRVKKKESEINNDLSINYAHVSQNDQGDGDKELYYKEQDCVV